jgi:hypothetical protein
MLFDFNGAIVDDTTGTSGEILNHPSNVIVFVNRGGHVNQTVTPSIERDFAVVVSVAENAVSKSVLTALMRRSNT